MTYALNASLTHCSLTLSFWDRENQVNYGTVEIAYIPGLEGEFACPVASFP